jgi:hypothetical protein
MLPALTIHLPLMMPTTRLETWLLAQRAGGARLAQCVRTIAGIYAACASTGARALEFAGALVRRTGFGACIAAQRRMFLETLIIYELRPAMAG